MFPAFASLQRQLDDNAERLHAVEEAQVEIKEGQAEIKTTQTYLDRTLEDIKDTQKRHTWLLIGVLVSIVSGASSVIYSLLTHFGGSIVQQLVSRR